MHMDVSRGLVCECFFSSTSLKCFHSCAEAYLNNTIYSDVPGVVGCVCWHFRGVYTIVGFEDRRRFENTATSSYSLWMDH